MIRLPEWGRGLARGAAVAAKFARSFSLPVTLVSPSQRAAHRLVRLRHIELLRVEPAAAPALQLSLLLKLVRLGTEQYAQEFERAVCPTDFLRWTGARAPSMQVAVLGAGFTASRFSSVTVCCQLSPKS